MEAMILVRCFYLTMISVSTICACAIGNV